MGSSGRRIRVFATVEGFVQMEGFVPVAVDVLRATSTICTALAAGAAGVRVFLEPAEALAAARESGGGVVLGGERDGVLIPGFDLGNSPAEYTADTVGGREVLFTTSNGTRAILAGAALGDVYIGSFLNRAALAQALAGRDLALICAGTLGRWSPEDLGCAGALCDAAGPAVELDETGVLARALYRDYRERLGQLMRDSLHGRRLAEIGLEADLDRCAAIDSLDGVPVLRGGRITLIRIP